MRTQASCPADLFSVHLLVGLSWLDRLLPLLILIAMIVGIVIGMVY